MPPPVTRSFPCLLPLFSSLLLPHRRALETPSQTTAPEAKNAHVQTAVSAATSSTFVNLCTAYFSRHYRTAGQNPLHALPRLSPHSKNNKHTGTGYWTIAGWRWWGDHVNRLGQDGSLQKLQTNIPEPRVMNRKPWLLMVARRQ